MKHTFSLSFAAAFVLMFYSEAMALTVTSCNDSLYEMVQTCRDYKSIHGTKMPSATQRSYYNNVIANCFPAAFQGNNGADQVSGNSTGSKIEDCSDISSNKAGSFNFKIDSPSTNFEIYQNNTTNESCKIDTFNSSSIGQSVLANNFFCYATNSNNETQRTEAAKIHNITQFFRDFVEQSDDPLKEQFRKDNLATAKANCDEIFEYYIDSSSVEINPLTGKKTIYLRQNMINILNKYVFESSGNSASFTSNSSSPTALPNLVLVTEVDITSRPNTYFPSNSYKSAYVLTSGKYTLDYANSFTGGINARELEISETSCSWNWWSQTWQLNIFKGTSDPSCELEHFTEEITYSYYRIYLEQLSGCAKNVSLVVKECSQGGFCDTPSGNVTVRINGHNYTANSSNNYSITFPNNDVVTYNVNPVSENTLVFCGTSNTALAENSCSFTSTECVEAETSDIENYVNSVNTQSFYTDTLASEVTAVNSVNIKFKGNTETIISDTANGTTTLFSGKDHAQNFAEQTVSNIPVTYNTSTHELVPKFKFMTTVDRGTLYPVQLTLNITKTVFNYKTGKNESVSDTIDVPLNEGETPDQYLLAIPYVLCYDFNESANPFGTRVVTDKYRPLYVNAPYHLNSYGVACPDSGCTGSGTQSGLKNLCNTAPVVKVPTATGKSRSIVPNTLSRVSIDPAKLKTWSTSLSGNTLPEDQSTLYKIYNPDSSAEATYLNIGFTGGPDQQVQITNGGWYSFSSEQPIKPRTVSTIGSYVYSPVFSVIPKSLSIASDSYSVNDYYKFREISGFDFVKSGNLNILKNDIAGQIGVESCPFYYSQRATFSGYLGLYGVNGGKISSYDSSLYIVKKVRDKDYDGILLVAPMVASSTGYTEEPKYNPCKAVSADRSYCSGYDTFVKNKGIPFYTTVYIPNFNEGATRRKTGSEAFIFYSRINNCLANNNDYSFNNKNDCDSLSFTCDESSNYCVASNITTTQDTDLVGELSLNDDHVIYADKLRTLNSYTLYMGRISADNIVGTGTSTRDGGFENNALYTPLIIRHYDGTGWHGVTDNCSELYINDSGNYLNSLDFTNTSGTISYKLCKDSVDTANTECDDTKKRFSNGYLWLKAINGGSGDAYTTFNLKKSTGEMATGPFYHLGHLYDSSTSTGSFNFKTFNSNKRIIDRKFDK